MPVLTLGVWVEAWVMRTLNLMQAQETDINHLPLHQDKDNNQIGLEVLNMEN